MSSWYPSYIVGALRSLSVREIAYSAIAGVVTFALVGTLTALWNNPFFVRMTPAAGFELALLTVQSLLGGLYLGVRTSACAIKTAGSGGILGFLGVACPVCNKILVAIFGSGLLLTYFEPVRLYVGLVGTVALWFALDRKLRVRAAVRPAIAQREPVASI